MAYSYPYTYTNLKFDINELLMKSKENDLLNKTINCDVLCQTRAGNSCFLITITDQSKFVKIIEVLIKIMNGSMC